MATYTLGSKPAIVAAIAAGQAGVVSERIADLAARNGYTVGPDGIQVMGDGSVVIDLDHDPTADWATFDASALTEAEQEEQTLREQAATIVAALEAGTATAAQVMAAIAFLGRRYFELIGDPLP